MEGKGGEWNGREGKGMGKGSSLLFETYTPCVTFPPFTTQCPVEINVRFVRFKCIDNGFSTMIE